MEHVARFARSFRQLEQHLSQILTLEFNDVLKNILKKFKNVNSAKVIGVFSSVPQKEFFELKIALPYHVSYNKK